MTLGEIIQDAVKEFRGELANPSGWWSDEDDLIFSIADSHTPIHYAEILQLALDNFSLAIVEPDVGGAFDGSATGVNIIAAVIYETICEALWEEFRGIEQEREDAKEEEEKEASYETR